MTTVTFKEPTKADASSAPSFRALVAQFLRAANPLDSYIVTVPAMDPSEIEWIPQEGVVAPIATEFAESDFFEVDLSPDAFPFCGVLYTKLWVAASGYIQLWPDPTVTPPDQAEASIGLVAADERVIIAPWWQPLVSSGLGDGEIYAYGMGDNGGLIVSWKAKHRDDDGTDYTKRQFSINLLWKAVSGVHDRPGAIYVLFTPSGDLTTGGSPADPTDAAIGVKNGQAFRSPHDESNGSDATYPLPMGGHALAANAKVGLSIASGWGADLAAATPNGWYLFQPGDDLVHAVARGTHTVAVFAMLGWTSEQLATSGWTVTMDGDEIELGEVPRVSSIEDLGGGWILLHLDAALVHGQVYHLSLPAWQGQTPVASVDITGLSRSLARQSAPDGHALLDVDAPVLPADDGTEPQFSVKGGDYVLTGGIETITKVIWSALLEEPGDRYWLPDHGGQLSLQGRGLSTKARREEEARLGALLEAMPFIKAAVVQLIADGDHWVLAFRATTDLGLVTGRRTINAVG